MKWQHYVQETIDVRHSSTVLFQFLSKIEFMFDWTTNLTGEKLIINIHDILLEKKPWKTYWNIKYISSKY